MFCFVVMCSVFKQSSMFGCFWMLFSSLSPFFFSSHFAFDWIALLNESFESSFLEEIDLFELWDSPFFWCSPNPINSNCQMSALTADGKLNFNKCFMFSTFRCLEAWNFAVPLI